jgi:hypothetical protein
MGTMRPTAVVRGGSARHLSVPLSQECAPQLLFAQKSSHLHRLELIGEGATIYSEFWRPHQVVDPQDVGRNRAVRELPHAGIRPTQLLVLTEKE